MAYAAENPAATPAAYANWGQRVGAYLIDWAPIIMLELIGGISRNAFIWLLFILASLGWWIYNRCIQAGRTGQSLGKKTLHLRLLSEKTGEPIGPGMAFARDICHILDSLASTSAGCSRSGTPSARRSQTRSSAPSSSRSELGQRMGGRPGWAAPHWH